jgi:diguanylate cyclase (GGDEF)-like protein
VLSRLQERYVAASEGVDLEEARRDPMWEITSLATRTIARFLVTGTPASPEERERIASVGDVAARQRHRAASSQARRPTRPAGERRAPEPGGLSPQRSAPGARVQLSVTMLTKLNFWWSEVTCAVLAEEAARLRLDPAALAFATDVVVRSCQASLVSMAKRFDAELRSLHDQLAHLALHDPLTGLANRALLVDHLDRALGRLERRRLGLAVVFVDLDGFKVVNDLGGHACGDKVLATVAGRLTQCVRPADLLARLGGDEFVAVLEDLPDPAEEACRLAERLRTVASEPVSVRGRLVRITVSVGAAVVRRGGHSTDELLGRADAAMYEAKRAGRDCVVVVDLDAEP